jgi:hypothetical protein
LIVLYSLSTKAGAEKINDYVIFNFQAADGNRKFEIVLSKDPVKLSIDFNKDKDFAGDSYIVITYKIE